jgi:hypothetical protein
MRNGAAVINDVGLAALALLVAESAPKDKDVMIRLVMNMLAEPAAWLGFRNPLSRTRRSPGSKAWAGRSALA